MRFMKTCLCAATALILGALALTGCTADEGQGQTAATASAVTDSARKDTSSANECYYGEVNYVSLLQWDSVLYGENYDSDLSGLHKGKRIGQITYSKTEHQCPRPEMQDGDATILEVGTELYEVKGYKPSARLWAGDKLFIAGSNPEAETINDLMDIAGKLQTVRFISGIDGSDLMDFTPEANAVFIREFPTLEYIPFKELYKQTKGWVGDKYSLEIEMKDGSTLRITYNTMFPSFQPSAYATPELAELVEQQRKLIYAK